AKRTASPSVVLVEGVCDVFRLAEAGIPAVACLGSDLTSQQSTRLSLLGKKVIVAFDADDAGREGAARALVELGRPSWARAVELPPSYKDVAEMSAEAVAKWFRGVESTPRGIT